MDLHYLKEVIEVKIAPIKVSLRHKAAYQGKQIKENNITSRRVRAIHINLNLDNFQNNIKPEIIIYRRLVLEFDNGRKMRLFTHPNLLKSNNTKDKLTKAYER